MDLKIVAGTSKEFSELQEAYIYFAERFIIKTSSKELWIESEKPSVRTLDDKFKDFSSSNVKGISIHTRKEAIEGVYNANDDMKDNIFYFKSNPNYFHIGIKTENTESEDYLFEVKYGVLDE